MAPFGAFRRFSPLAAVMAMSKPSRVVAPVERVKIQPSSVTAVQSP
jgi:hypothetical protein